MKVSVKKSRFRDVMPIYNQYGILTLRNEEILVRCPKCGGCASFKKNPENGSYLLRCQDCHLTQSWNGLYQKATAEGCCTACGRWFRLSLNLGQNGYHFVKVKCPACGKEQIAPMVQKNQQAFVDPFCGLELYLKSSYRGKPVWAYNREHLAYLIHYIRAGLREKPQYLASDGLYYFVNSGMSQSLPKFMKLSKNREGLLKVLLKLQKQ